MFCGRRKWCLTGCEAARAQKMQLMGSKRWWLVYTRLCLGILTRHSRNQTGLGSPKFFKRASSPHGYRAQKHPTKIFCQQKAEFHHKGTKWKSQLPKYSKIRFGSSPTGITTDRSHRRDRQGLLTIGRHVAISPYSVHIEDRSRVKRARSGKHS